MNAEFVSDELHPRIFSAKTEIKMQMHGTGDPFYSLRNHHIFKLPKNVDLGSKENE